MDFEQKKTNLRKLFHNLSVIFLFDVSCIKFELRLKLLNETVSINDYLYSPIDRSTIHFDLIFFRTTTNFRVKGELFK